MKVIIIGGGASGMMASIMAARSGHDVMILEQKDRIGKKILVTGNGRCNLTNERIATNPENSYPLCDSEFIKDIFGRFGYNETIDIFKELGLYLKSRDGLIYPYSDQASAVLDVLRFAIRDYGINVITQCKVNGITKTKNFTVRTSQGNFTADKVILSAGSKAQPKTGSDGSGYDIARECGHTIVNVTPGLVQLKCDGNFFKSVAGVRLKAKLTLIDDKDIVYEEAGEMQLTEYGISGIVAMNLSNRLEKCKSKDKYIEIDLMREYDTDELRLMLTKRAKAFSKKESSEFLIGIMPKKVSDLFLKLAGIGYDVTCDKINTDKIEILISLLKNWKLKVTGKNDFSNCQIALGGVDIDEVAPTMESKIVKGLYLCGEILNLHGDCGGYNLQLAWTTGAIAGMLI